MRLVQPEIQTGTVAAVILSVLSHKEVGNPSGPQRDSLRFHDRELFALTKLVI
jgi:hypothetical protein